MLTHRPQGKKKQVTSGSALAARLLVPRVGHADSTYCSKAFEGHPSFGIIRLLPWCSGCRSCTIK